MKKFKIKKRDHLDTLLDYGYVKVGKAYSKELARYEDGDIIIQIIIDPYNSDDEVILNTSIDGIELTKERQEYFCEEYHVDIWTVMREIQLLEDYGVVDSFVDELLEDSFEDERLPCGCCTCCGCSCHDCRFKED